MNLSRVYNKTTKGARAVSSKTRALSGQHLRILSHINGKAPLESIFVEVGKLTEKKFDNIITELFEEGYIKVTTEDSLLTPSQFEIRTPIVVEEISAEDFLSAAVPDENEDAKKEREQREAEQRAKTYAEEQARLEQAALDQQKAEQQMINVVDFLSESSVLTDLGAPTQPLVIDTIKPETGNNDDVIAKEQAHLEAEIKADEEAIRKIREEAAARQKSVMSHTAYDEVAARTEAERKIREEAEVQAKRVAVEKERLRIEYKAREDAEIKAHDEAMVRAKREEDEKIRLEAEIKAREDAMRKAREVAETRARRAAEEKARLEAERAAREVAKVEAEAKAKVKTERRTREAEEARVKREAEEQSKREAKRLAREATESRAKAEAEEKAKAEAERSALKQAKAERQAEAKLQAKREAEEKALAKAEEKARRRAEQGSVDIYNSIQPIISSVIASFWTLITSLSVITLLLLVFAQYISLNMLVAPVQKLASESMQEPVTIGSIHASFWPQPHLVLSDVAIGQFGNIKASNVNAYPLLLSMFSEVKTLKSLEVEALTLDQDSLARPSRWIAASNQLGKLKIDRIYLKKTVLKTHNFDLPVFNTDIKLDTDGRLKDATITNDNHHLSVVITPENNSNDSYAISLAAQDWQAPLGPAIVFDELDMHGSVSHGQANLGQIDAKLYSGTMHAQLTINWVDLWSAIGSFQLAKVNLEKITPIFSDQASLKGRLSGTGTFSMKANELQKLTGNPEISANFEAIDGYVGRIDLVRTMQVGGNEQAGGGSTHFEALSGNLGLKNGYYQFRQLTLDAGQLKATGEVDIQDNQSITGTIHTELNLKSRQLESNATLTGTLGSPSLN